MRLFTFRGIGTFDFRFFCYVSTFSLLLTHANIKRVFVCMAVFGYRKKLIIESDINFVCKCSELVEILTMVFGESTLSKKKMFISDKI